MAINSHNHKNEEDDDDDEELENSPQLITRESERKRLRKGSICLRLLFFLRRLPLLLLLSAFLSRNRKLHGLLTFAQLNTVVVVVVVVFVSGFLVFFVVL